MIPQGRVWVLGIAGNARGLSAALLQTDGTGLFASGPGIVREWSTPEANALATPGPAAAELAETAAASLAAALCRRGDAPEPILAGVAFEGAVSPDAAILAEVAGLPMVWDFCSADRALGGAGRPLAPVFLHALSRSQRIEGSVAFVDLDRSAALCLVDPARPDPGQGGVVLAFDAGPGLGLMPLPVATEPGQVVTEALDAARTAAFFSRLPPRLLSPGDLPGLPAALANLSPSDAIATLRALVAVAIEDALTLLPSPPAKVVLTGPGRNDACLRRILRHQLTVPVLTAEETGLDGDLIAAQKIAFLALRVARGLPTSFPSTTGVAAAVGGGQIARPGGRADPRG